MTNTLTNIMPKILARGLMSLREKVMMPRLVNLDYNVEAAQKGDVINVPIPAPQTASSVTPSNTPPAPASVSPGNVQIEMDSWEHSDFHLNDKELTRIDRDRHFVPMQMEEAIRALANSVNLSIHGQYKGVYGYVGTAGATPFQDASGTNPEYNTNAARLARKILNKQLAYKSNRSVVMDHDAEANALGLAAFRDASQSGKDTPVIEGELGRFFGMNWFTDDHVLTHTSTTFTAGACTVNGANAVGAGSTDNGKTGTVSIAKATNATPLVEGDILTFAGDTQTYTVVTAVTLAVGNTTVTISPALKVAKTGGEVVTKAATHVVNLAFNKYAFAFVSRPLVSTSADLELGNRILSLADPLSGIVLRLEVSRQYKQTVWDFDILWGTKLVRPELACRIAG